MDTGVAKSSHCASFGCLFACVGQFCIVFLSRRLDNKSGLTIGFLMMASFADDARIQALSAFVKLVPWVADEQPPSRKAFSEAKLDDES